MDTTEQMLAQTENILDRYGIISRRAVMAENLAGGFPAMRTLCRSMEDTGRILRGRFVEGLGGAQFAERNTIDRLRDLAATLALKAKFTPLACQPAILLIPGIFAALAEHSSSLVPTRRTGALVVICGGRLQLYLAQGGRKMLVWYHDESEILLPDVLQALTNGLRREPRLRFTLLEINDKPVRQSPLFTPLREVGFSSSPQGLDWG